MSAPKETVWNNVTYSSRKEAVKAAGYSYRVMMKYLSKGLTCDRDVWQQNHAFNEADVEQFRTHGVVTGDNLGELSKRFGINKTSFVAMVTGKTYRYWNADYPPVEKIPRKKYVRK